MCLVKDSVLSIRPSLWTWWNKCVPMARTLKNDYIKSVNFTELQLAVFEIGYCWNHLGECLQIA